MHHCKIWASILVGVFILLFISKACAQEKSNILPRFKWKGPDIGSQIRDFELPTLTGEKFRLSNYKGKIIVIEMGACT
jgi:cytochrome oxidase Cu insertion factor (SCO1/SenC/PrrC family)